jgi:glycosyltransferase involved in cell wall biosynthesis
MRYLFVSEYFYPHWTGIAKSFLNLALSLHENSHVVEVLTTRHSRNLPIEETFQGIRIHRAPYLLRVSRTHYSFALNLVAFRKMSAADVVVINSPCSNILPISLLAKLYGTRLLIFHQGDLTLPKSSGMFVKARAMEVIFDVFTRLSMRLADVVSTYTEDYARHSRVISPFMKSFSPLIPRVRLPHGTPNEEFLSRLSILERNKVLVGFAGRFVEEKGFDILLQSIPLVIAQNKDVHFVFAGETEISYEKCFQKYSDHVNSMTEHLTLLGLLSDGDLREFYRALSLFVISSRSDCFPVTQIEAALNGTPIVVTDIPGARMFVKETGFGEIVPPEDPEALAEGIVKSLSNLDSYQSKRSNVKRYLTEYERLATD